MAILDAQLGASRGDAVLALLERAEVPPVPPFYKLCYDYLAGVKTLDAIRAGALIEAPHESGQPAAEQLYEEFIAPYEHDDSINRVVGTMVERIGVLEKLVVQSQEATRHQAADLAGATADLEGEDIDAALLGEWITRLKLTGSMLRKANAALTAELDQTLEVFTNAKDEMDALSRAVQVDSVTGIANRAGVDAALAEAVADVEARKGKLAIAVIDVDHFKKLNDTYGHPVGDEILRIVGRALLAATRDGDIIGRMGGDEFILVIRDEDLQGAKLIAERVRRSVVDCDLGKLLGKGIVGSVTASIGVAQYLPGDALPAVYERADKCLFEAKRSGRNQVVADGISNKRNAAA